MRGVCAAGWRHMRSVRHTVRRELLLFGLSTEPTPLRARVTRSTYEYWPRIFIPISISIPLSLIVHLFALNCSCLSGRYRYSIFSWWPAKWSIKAAAKALRQLLSSPCGFSRLSGQSFGEHEEQSALVCPSCRDMFALAAPKGRGRGRLAVVGL